MLGAILPDDGVGETSVLGETCPQVEGERAGVCLVYGELNLPMARVGGVVNYRLHELARKRGPLEGGDHVEGANLGTVAHGWQGIGV